MSRTIPRTLLSSFLAITLLLVVSLVTFAQSSQSQSAHKAKPVKFKIPDGYMPADFPEKRLGKLMLDPKRPDGMFVAYSKDDENPDALTPILQSMVTSMFFHETKSPVEWTKSTLPAHEAIDNEPGTLYSASNGEMEIQLALYARVSGTTKLVYGYYGMRHKPETKKDDASFLDSSGKGVKDFDKFWQSIKNSK